ncbi:MAG: hypothetical protein ACTSQA_09345 [Candidatus Heimdallarchaeaceae archaeon]
MLPTPLRNDLAEIKIVKKKGELKDNNAIWLPSKKNSQCVLRISEHKTSQSPAEAIERVLDVDLSNDIKAFVRRRELIEKRVYLFEDRKGNPYSSSSFCHRMNRLFKTLLGVPFSSCVLRKLFWSAQKSTIDDMKESAKMCGHSLSTAMNIYMGDVKKT